MPKEALINGQAYSWSNIIFNVLGVNIIGIDAINYDEEQDMEDNFGAGNRPVSRGYGNITTTGSISLHMNELEALQQVAPDGSIFNINEFDIVISFQPLGGKIVNHTLKNTRFKKNGRDIKQNDKNIKTDIPLQIGQILWK